MSRPNTLFSAIPSESKFAGRIWMNISSAQALLLGNLWARTEALTLLLHLQCIGHCLYLASGLPESASSIVDIYLKKKRLRMAGRREHSQQSQQASIPDKAIPRDTKSRKTFSS